jgi:hypothetical protein
MKVRRIKPNNNFYAVKKYGKQEPQCLGGKTKTQKGEKIGYYSPKNIRLSAETIYVLSAAF